MELPRNPERAWTVVEAMTLAAGVSPRVLRTHRNDLVLDRVWQAPIVKAFGARSWGALGDDLMDLLVMCRAATKALVHLVDDREGGAIGQGRGNELEKRVWALALAA